MLLDLPPELVSRIFEQLWTLPDYRIAVWLVYFTSPSPVIDLQQWDAIHNLHWFHVSRSVLRATSPFCLDNLVRLGLVDVILDPPDLLATLTPAHLPSLRALLVLDSDGIIPSLLNPALLSQLECVQVEVTGRYEPPEDNGTPTLFFVYQDLLGASPANLGWSATRAAKVRHLRCIQLGDVEESGPTAFADAFHQLPNLKTLWLPHELFPDELLPSSTETSASSAESVLALCRQRSVSVHWVRDMPEYSIVRGFWDYAKKRKAKGEV
ncbi:hypothetical protein JCM3770_002532 [Rhodotorula araucariae]